MLVWFALSIGVAIASPFVQPQGTQLLCAGSGVVKLVVVNPDSGKISTPGHTLDCPLCAALGAPPLMLAYFGAAVPSFFAAISARPSVFAFENAAPPPARGPPSRF